jgi:hypothetical protein
MTSLSLVHSTGKSDEGTAWSIGDEATRLVALLQRERPEIARALICQALRRAYIVGRIDQIWRDDEAADDPGTPDPQFDGPY